MDIFTPLKLALKISPASINYKTVGWLAERPPGIRPTAEEKQLLRTGEAFTFGDNGRTRYAWRFGNGPLVICIHGWGGLAAHMTPLAREIAGKGYTAVVFDVTGHGRSVSKRVSFRDFSKDLGALAKKLDCDIHALVGHSAGALCMMASRELEGITASKYVCISAPIRPYPPLKIMRKKLSTPKHIIDKYSLYLADQFGHSWQTIPEHAYHPDGRSELLIIHDTTDKFVSHEDADTIHALWPASALMKTTGNNHRSIVWDPAVKERAVNFIQNG